MSFMSGKKKYIGDLMIDQFDEMRKAKEWTHKESDDGMTVDDMAEIVIKGFGHCEEVCWSREFCGEDVCACVRDVFPTPQHYGLYKEARAFFEKELTKASFIRLLSKGAVFSAEKKG